MKATHQQRAALTGALAMVLTWCGTAGAAMRDVELGTGTKLAFATIEKGIYGDWARPTLLAARSDGEWNAAMEELAAQGALIVAPPPSAPALDWSRQLTVLVALGNMDGYSVEITKVSRIGHTLVLDVHVEMGRRSGEMDISPYHLVSVDDAGQVNLVVARYDWAPPGLQTTASVSGSTSTLGQKAGNRAVPEGAAEPAVGASETHAAPGMTWGSLKVRYR